VIPGNALALAILGGEAAVGVTAIVIEVAEHGKKCVRAGNKRCKRTSLGSSDEPDAQLPGKPESIEIACPDDEQTCAAAAEQAI